MSNKIKFGLQYLHVPPPKWVLFLSRLVKRITGLVIMGDAGMSLKYDFSAHPGVIIPCALLWIITDELIPYIGEHKPIE